jgi:large subunit ribosomal protein L30
MIITIRISGLVGLTEKVKETLYRLRLRKKYTAVLLKPTKENLKTLIKIRNLVAYGDIDEETLKKLIEKRGIPKNKKEKINPESVINNLEKKSLKDLDIKPFFHLHPPRGGIDSKKHFGTSRKAVLGDNKKKINDLVRRML